MKIFDMSMTVDEISPLSDTELADGLAIVRRITMDSAQDLIKKEKQLAAIRRVRQAIARNSETDKTPTMIEFNNQLLDDYRSMSTELKYNQSRHELLVTIRKLWLDEEAKRTYQAWQDKLDADLIDPDCVPVVETKHCCCHSHRCCS